MFSILGKKAPDIDYTFSDGGRYIANKGKQQYYPPYSGPNLTNTFFTEDFMEWTDTHPEMASISMTLPGPYRANLAHLFGGDSVFRMQFTDPQKAKVAEFFDQLKAQIEDEKESAAAAKALNTQQAKRREVVEKQISVLINGKPAAISCDDLSLGEVSCPVCNNQVTTPGGGFDMIRDALENTIGIQPFAAETLTHCKTCNELYQVEIDIKRGIV